MASNMTDFYETSNLSLLSSKEHIMTVIKDPSPSQEPPLHNILNSSRVSLSFRRVLDGLKHDRFLLNLKLMLIVIK